MNDEKCGVRMSGTEWCQLPHPHEGGHSSDPDRVVHADVDYEVVLKGLKVEINTLVWARCPGTLTLAEADRVAGAIYELISATWKK